MYFMSTVFRSYAHGCSTWKHWCLMFYSLYLSMSDFRNSNVVWYVLIGLLRSSSTMGLFFRKKEPMALMHEALCRF